MDIGPKNIGKRKLRASSAYQDLLKGLQELWGALGMLSRCSLKSLPGDSWAILSPARASWTTPETSHGSPRDMPELSPNLPGASRRSPELVTNQQPPNSNRQPAVTSLQRPVSDVLGSKEGVRRQEAEGP